MEATEVLWDFCTAVLNLAQNCSTDGLFCFAAADAHTAIAIRQSAKTPIDALNLCFKSFPPRVTTDAVNQNVVSHHLNLTFHGFAQAFRDFD